LKEQSKIYFNKIIGKALAKRIKLERASSASPRITQKHEVLEEDTKFNSSIKKQLQDIIQLHSKAVKKQHTKR
jgi:hypothetical protein